jgi:hypothetical protein
MPTPKQIKTKPVCTECGSDNVNFDAWASWNPETQKYELQQTFDDSYCNACDGECKVDWVPADTETIEKFSTPCGSMSSEEIEEHVEVCEVCAAEHARTPLDL